MKEFESEFGPEEQLGSDLAGLAMKWRELGIDPDDFVKCAECGQYFVDEQGNPIPCGCKEEIEE